MITAPPQRRDVRSVSVATDLDSHASDLRFISELGRGLLVTYHPKKAAGQVTKALLAATGATACVFAAEIDSVGLVCATSSQDDSCTLRRAAFAKWLAFMPPQIGHSETIAEEFLIDGGGHVIEYVSPLQIDGKVSGAIVLGFKDAAELTESRIKLIDAATQMAALSINLAAHYENEINDSIVEARQEQRKFTEAVLDALPVSLYVVDRNYKIVTWNRHREIGEQGIPREVALGRDVFDVLERYPQGRLREEFERAFRTGKIERIEQQTVAEDGSARHWLVSKVPMRSAESGEVTHVITIGEDVTLRVNAVQAINRAEKLAAVGRLAAGVVHEINNPLATIAACAEALEHRIEEGAFDTSESVDDLAEYLGLIKSEAFRCKTITMDLLDFSRTRAGERAPCDPGEIVRSAANLVSHQKRGTGIIQDLDIAPDLPFISADAGQIQQAVIALATNGIDAMSGVGRLTFRVFSQNGRVVIEVEDNGSGISPENMSKIFEPFFTTKEVGKGTGLGLAVCYGIVTEHGGRISVRSNLGKGTTFSIFLPAVEPPLAD
jgi:two-component system, NtrC family, sensor kinase